jgi:N-methylhydantoinase A
VVEAFHGEHEREHSYRREDSPVEVYQLNVRAVGDTEKAELPSHDSDGGDFEPCGSREVVFDRGEDAVEAPVYARDDLPAGASFEGPALIDQLDSTVLVPPGVTVEVDEWLNIRMQIEQEDES